MSKAKESSAHASLRNTELEVYEEDNGLDLNVDICSVPISSQEALMEIFSENGLEENESIDVSDALETLLGGENTAENENHMLVELIDVACDAPRKSEEFSDEALVFIANPKNFRSRKLCEKYQREHINYCEEHKLMRL